MEVQVDNQGKVVEMDILHTYLKIKTIIMRMYCLEQV